MKTAGLKYIFYAFSLVLLVMMLLFSRKAGITCDEVIHYGQSVSVYNYFASRGEDQSAINTGGTHLKYYGQSYDNIVTILAKWFSIDDIYSFRHIMSSLAGWMAVVITALFAVWLAGWQAGIVVIFLFAVSPAFMGHSQNNLKDIPFALAYISGIFFSLKVVFNENKISFIQILLLLLSMAFCLSIRAGGLILFCYLFLFLFVSVIHRRLKHGMTDMKLEGIRFVLLVLVSIAAYILAVLLWPYALQSPVKNVIESYRVMAHFPSTFRQIFEGEYIWSDMMPWYYLLKSMAITIPLVVLAGMLIFFLLSVKLIKNEKGLLYGMVLFTILFPVIFVMIEGSNLYSSWRQFLFVYPPLLLLAGTGISVLFDTLKRKYLKIILLVVLLVMALHPAKFIIRDPAYSYIYYNQFTGGLKGAYGNYETDYYYVSQTEAAGWLKAHLQNNLSDSSIIMVTSPDDWNFRDCDGVKVKYARYEERSMHEWDYAIVGSRFIRPELLKKNLWPPANAIHVVYAGEVPVGAVLKRGTKAGYEGYKALSAGNNALAVNLLTEALKADAGDEMIFYNFARALYNVGRHAEADSVLKAGLEVNPFSESILMYLGNIAAFKNDTLAALGYYEKVIGANRKYLEAYVVSARLLSKSDVTRARVMIRRSLEINPEYIPALALLAETYRETDPDIAEKYDKLILTIK